MEAAVLVMINKTTVAFANRRGNICRPRCVRSWRSYELCRCVRVCVFEHEHTLMVFVTEG